MSVTLIVGTVKGAWVLRADRGRERWSVEGPLFKGWKVTAAASPDQSGQVVLATASEVYGPAVHLSRDLKTWQQVEAPPRFAAGSPRKVNQIWTFLRAGARLYAGGDEAELFSSDDGGRSWQHVEGLSSHRSRDSWFPGFGGLCAHTILVDPGNANRLWCGISAVGVFRSDDGGRSWHGKND